MDIKNNANWIIGGAAVIIVILVGWWLFSKPVTKDVRGAATTTGMTATTSTTTSGAVSTNMVEVNIGEEVTVHDQPAGDSVRVAQAKLSRVSWIAVRDDMRIYGAVRLNPAGNGQTFTDIAIPLLRNTEAGKTYKVVVYADDGDGVFDFHKDALVNGLSGSFMATNGD